MTGRQAERAVAILAGARRWVAENYGVRWDTLMGTRQMDAVMIRANVAARMREEGLSLNEIGRMLDRDHTTVVYYLQTLDTYKRLKLWETMDKGIEARIDYKNNNTQTQKKEIMINATIMGTIGRDAEVRTVGKKEYASFSVAVDGRKDEETTWVKVLAYNGNGSQYYRKGARVVAVGRLTFGVYNDKPDVTMWADHVEMAKFAEPEKGGSQGAERQPAKPQAEAAGPAYNDDLPF